jgi:hypothetical protein
VTPIGHLTEEQLSAVVEHEAGPAATGHLAACPECAARLSDWQASVDQLRVPVAVPVAAKEEAVAAALAASGDLLDATARFDDERARRAGRNERWKALSWVAAAAVVVAAAGFGLSHLSSSHSASTSSGASRATSPAPAVPAAPTSLTSPVPTAASSSGAALPQGTTSAGATHSPGLGIDFGTLTGPADVTQQVRVALARLNAAGPAALNPTARAPTTMAPAFGSESPNCAFPSSGPGSAAQGRLLLAGRAVYRSAPAVIYVVADGSARTAIVYQAANCRILLQVPV